MRWMPEAGRETSVRRTFLDQPSLEAALAALAARQHAVFALAQLRELGLPTSTVRTRAAIGRLHRVHRAVYSLVPPQLLTREGRYMAAILACGPGAVLSHRSAAALHELRRTDRARIEVTVPRRSARTHPGIQVHRSITLAPADITRIGNIPCTTVARTQLDLADVLNRRGVERVYDQAAILEVFDLSALEDQLQRNPTRPAAPRVRAVLDEHQAGRTVTWNDFEERFLTLTRAAKIPDPDVNAWIVLPDGGPAIRVDFVWREQRVAVETDGWATHRTRSAFETDRVRDQRMITARWLPIRVTWRQMTREPRELTARLLALLNL